MLIISNVSGSRKSFFTHLSSIMKKSHIHTFGSRLEDGKAHREAHTTWSRRDFITQMGFAGGMAMLMGGMSLRTLGATPIAHALNAAESDRILVLIQLKGGNDGLNTIIPLYDYGYYATQRPTIRIPEAQITNLSAEHGIPNYMGDLLPLWQNGQMKVIHSVGYPDQNLSHFRSTDIWSSASDANTLETSGWLARWLDNEYPDFINQPPETPPALQIGGSANVLFNNGEINMSVTVANPEQLFEIAQTGQLYNPEDVPNNCYGTELQFMRTVANSTFRYAEAIKNAYDAGANDTEYENSPIERQLALVARLIKGNLGTCLYLVSIDGFDTHASQNNTHPYLLSSIAKAVNSFYEDLSQGNWSDKVLSMTFSEFGRRIEQNASLGTDHGSAAPLMMFGPGLNGSGFIGNAPNLQQPDAFGNLQFHTDFREIYATVLENWLCVDKPTVDGLMGRPFSRVDDLGLSCATTSRPKDHIPHLLHHALYDRGAGNITVQYELPRSTSVHISLLNMMGQEIKVLKNQREAQGKHQIHIPYRSMGLSAGTYVYRIETMGHSFSRMISVMR